MDIVPHFKTNPLTALFLDTSKARSFNLYMIIILLGLYIVILGLMTLVLSQGNECVRNINCKLLVLDSCTL